MKILLTVGHSILKTGHCTSADGRPYGGVLEYTYNKSIAEDIRKYLQSAGHEVKLVICPELQFAKSTDERPYKLKIEKAANYDLVAELHLNASALHNGRGCEVLYKSEKGKMIAQQIQKQLATAFRNRGIQKRDNLYMLTQTKAPAVIIESFFCDSSADCAIAEKTDVALLIAQGIHGAPIRQNESVVGSGFLYRVQLGAFRKKQNAEKLEKELENRGYWPFVTSVDLDGILYRVQVGAYAKKENAAAMKERLSAEGYTAVIVQV